MPGDHDLQALRTRIREFEAGAREKADRSAISLGEPSIDGALPANGPISGLAPGALHEVVPAAYSDFSAALGFCTGLLVRVTLAQPGPVLWCAPARDPGIRGAAYPLGLSALGLDPNRLIYLQARKEQDVLWTLEEGLASATCAAVVGLLTLPEKLYDFTASRRLSLRAADSGVTALLLRRHDRAENSSAALTRWMIQAQPSRPVRHAGQAVPGLGPPRWRVTLSQCKRGRPGTWLVEWDHETLSFRLATPLADRTPLRTPGKAIEQWAIAS